MNSKVKRNALWHLIWVAVGLFWYFTTRDFHPTAELAVIVTVSLVTAFAITVDINHFLLIPQYCQTRRYGTYSIHLLATMAATTAVALTVIRASFFRLHGPDADPYGMYKHFVIDLFGNAVHVGVAGGAVRLWRRIAYQV